MNSKETVVQKLEYMRKQARNGELRTDSNLVVRIEEDVKVGRWLKESNCCGTMGCCDNSMASY